MPIETPAGTLEVENAKFRASSVEATIAVGIGTESNDAYPLQVFKETSPDIRLSEGSTISSAARFYSNNSNLYIQTGTNFTSGSSGDIAFQTMVGQSTHMVIKSDGNVGIGTTSPRGMLDIYTGATSTAGLIIDRYASGTYRSELYQESDGLAIKVGDGSNAPAENMRITRTTTATPGKLTVGTSTASGSQMFVYAPGNGSTTAHTDLHVLHNGNMIMYGTRPWITTTNGQGHTGKLCSINFHTSGHQPAIEWVRNNGQGTNQRNWLLRQETDDALYTWYYDGSAWSVPMFLKSDALISNNNVGIRTANPIAALDINGGAENNTTPALAIRGGLYDTSDLYVLNTYSVSTGVGYAAKVIGVNIKNKVETDNTVQIRNNVGGLTSAGAIYIGSDDTTNQGIFGVLGGTGTAGTTLAELLTVKGNGNVGIGTNAPQAALHVAGDSGPSNTSKVLGVHMGVYSSIYPHIEIVASGSNTGWIDFKNANTGGNGDHSERIRGGSGHLEFITNMSERMRIDSSGNVGIGLTGPESKLHIYGSDNPLMLQSQRSPYPKLSYDFSGTNAENFQFYDHHGSGRGFLYGRKYTTGTNPNANAGWHFYGNDNTLALRIDGSANVGIGTASPGAKLDVNGGIRYDTSLVSTSSTQRLWTSGSSVNWIQFHTSGTSTNHILDIQANNGNCVLSSRSSTPLLLNPSNGGNVGIGTASPSYNLDVNGSFGAKNKGWYITGGGGNAVYNGANPNKNYFAYNVNNTVYGSSVTTYNGASSSAWRSNDGVFTYPEAGLYQVTIHMFINATSSGRYGVFRLNDSGGTSQFSQYMYFTPSGYAAQYQRSWTTFVRVESGWQSYMQPESGSITLYLANQHTCLLIDKIC